MWKTEDQPGSTDGEKYKNKILTVSRLLWEEAEGYIGAKASLVNWTDSLSSSQNELDTTWWKMDQFQG